MFLQSVTTRIAVMITVLTISLTGIAYGVGHLSDRPLYMAYVEPSASTGDRTLYAYLVDPIRRLNISIEIPSQLTALFYNTSPNEPYSIFIPKYTADAESGKTIGRLYRYNLRTQELTTIHQTEYDGRIPSLPWPAIGFDGFTDLAHYIVADKFHHAIVLIDRKTLAQQILWQGEVPPDESLDYTLRVVLSPARDKYAILDSSQEAMVTIVRPTGEVLNEFQVTELPESVVNNSQLSINWMDNQHVLVTTLTTSGTDAVVPIYDTVTGEANPYTESLRAFNVQPVYGCQDQGQWISYSQRIAGNLYQVFTMNLATGATHEHATFTLDTYTGSSGLPTRSNTDCSILLQTTPGTESGMNDVYLTTLTGDNIQLLLSDVLVGSFIDEDTFTYTQANETGGYDVYAMSLDDELTTERLLTDLPTPDAAWISDLPQRGWYVFLDNRWNRTPSQFPTVSGNPLLYYHVHSRDVHVLTPPGLRIMWFTELPSS